MRDTTFPFERKAARILAAFALFAAALGSGAAQAQGSDARQACAPDVKSLCSGVQPGGGRIVACLRDNAAKLSPGCKTALQSAKAAR